MFSEGGQTGVEIVFTKQDANRNAMEVQTLLLTKPVKKFASDKDEGVFLKWIFMKAALQRIYNLELLDLWLVRYEPTSIPNFIVRCSSPGLFAAGVKK